MASPEIFDIPIGKVVGPKGDTGNGIASIQLLSTSGLQKTYRINMTNETHFDFVVTDGNGISGASFDPETNELTITFDNGTSFTTPSLQGAPGDPGDDGYSPAVTIDTITGGHRVTITDKTHPTGQSFDVMDGASDAGNVSYDESATYQAGSVGAELQEQTRQISDVEENQIPELKSAVVYKTAMVNCRLVEIPESANRCNMEAIIPNKAINWYTGAITDNTDKCLYSIEVNPGDSLYFWALNPNNAIVSSFGIAFSTYDINNNHTTQGSGTYSHEYTVPNDVYSLTITLNQNWVNSGYKYIILINDSTQPVSYEPYVDAHSEYVAKNEFLANASIVGEKKFSIDVYPQNRYINYDGIISNNANFLTTDYIQVYESDIINAAGYSYVDTKPIADLRTEVVAFFSADFSYISGIYSTDSSGLVTVEDASVPSGAKYVVFGKHTSLKASNSYAYITRRYANIEKTSGENVPVRILPVLPVKKTISILGDSISQGEVATDRPNDSYAGILRQLFGLEYGNHMNYGFVSMSRDADMVYLSNWSGWTETTGSTTAIGGDEFATTTAGSKLTFRIGKQFSKVKIATKFGSGYGTLTLAQGESALGVVDCSTGDGAGFSEAIDISSADFSQAFTLTASGSASVSGLVLIDDDDYWTFMNYGRSGAAASVFTGDTFDIQTNADIVIYALGVNGTSKQLLNSLNDIKTRFSGLDAHKIVLDLNFTTAQRNGASKHSLLKQFANETGAKYICVWDYVPKDETTGYVASGFLNTDGIHPIDAGHQFIAELVAKEIDLSVNSKEFAQDVLNTKITWNVE